MLSFLKKEPEAPPLNPSVILAEAQQFLEKEDFEGALTKFDELCSLSVQSPLPLVSRATCRLQLKMYEGVLEDCEKVLKFLNSDIVGHEGESCTTVHSLALLRMAKAYKELGRLDEAKSALMRRNAIEHKLGRASVDDTDAEQAAEDQKSAIEWKEKGNEEYKKENWSQALEHYRAGLAYDMYNAKLHGNTCMALIKLKRWSQALKHAEQCIALEPNWAKGYYMKGLILSKESKLEQARDVLLKANAMESNNAQIKTLLDEVEARVEYVETRLRRRKTKQGDSANQNDGDKKSAGDSGNEATEEQQLVEDVD
ncbi:Stress-induced-phosphoprotein 1, partial [Coemansia guatemalensis]